MNTNCEFLSELAFVITFCVLFDVFYWSLQSLRYNFILSLKSYLWNWSKSYPICRNERVTKKKCFAIQNLIFSSIISSIVVATSKLDSITLFRSNKIITCFVLLIGTPRLGNNLGWRWISKLNNLNDFFGLCTSHSSIDYIK